MPLAPDSSWDAMEAYLAALYYGKHSVTTVYGKDPQFLYERMGATLGTYRTMNNPNYRGRHRISRAIGIFVRVVELADGRVVQFTRTCGGL